MTDCTEELDVATDVAMHAYNAAQASLYWINF